MAEANWLRKTPPAAELDEDPFAELTRIMGFDPRVPFRSSRQEEAPEPPAAMDADAGAEDLDLSLDLEQELAGALEPEDPAVLGAHPVGPVEGIAEAASSSADATGIEPLHEEAYGGADEGISDHAYWPEQGSEASLPSVDETVFADYLSEALPQAVEAEAAADGDALYDEPVSVSDGELHPEAGYEADGPAGAVADEAELSQAEFRQAGFPVGSSSAEADDPEMDAAVDDTTLAAELDHALSMSLDGDSIDDEDWLSAGEAEFAAPPPAAAEIGRADTSSDPFGGEFDRAMADVDMDFSLSSPAESAWDEGVPEEVSLVDDPHDAPVSEAPADGSWAVGAEQGDSAVLPQGEPQAEESPALAWDAQDPAMQEDLAPQYEQDPVDDWEDDPWTGVADDAAGSVLQQGAPQADESAGFVQGDEDFAVQSMDEQEGDDVFASSQAGEDDLVEDAAGSDAHSYDIAQSEIDDAIAELAAMVRGYDRLPVTAETSDHSSHAVSEAPEADYVPDIDTVDVPETAVALADDLEIPEIEYEHDSTPLLDDLDAELAAAFGQPAIEAIQPPQSENTAQAEFDADDRYDTAAPDSQFAGAAAYAGAAASHGGYQAAAMRGAPGEVQIVRREPAGEFGVDDDFEVDADPEDDLAAGNVAYGLHRPSARRGIVVASIVGGVAMIGAIGAFAFTGGDANGTGAPALVKADTDPVKVRPANPGGAVVANQDSGVFARAAGEKPGQPEQRELISTAEEPVDVAARFPEAGPDPLNESADVDALAEQTVKAEDRIQPSVLEAAPAEEDVLAVPPRKVRTMIVKPDGTLVPREEPAEQPATVGSTTAAGSLTDPSISAPETQDEFSPAAGEPAIQAAADGAAPAEAAEAVPGVAGEPQAAMAATEAAGPQDDTRASAGEPMPDRVPVAPSRPADQPMEIVGEVKPDQVASLDPQIGALPANTWSMQIASQPSEAAAQKTYQDLSRKFAGVLEGRGANIVKADIAGKGTFWRVRVPAGSRNEAIELCESYKAAGGNCFVSK